MTTTTTTTRTTSTNTIIAESIDANKTPVHHSPSITNVVDFDPATEAAANVAPPSPFVNEGWRNAASKAAGARILFATDEWFATADRLLEDTPPTFDPDAYCVQGKVMDGWESRRRREAGHDWSILQLTGRTHLLAVEIDTAHFTGNHAPQISLQVADLTAAQTMQMVAGFPAEMTLTRLLYGGGIQGTGATPDQIEHAEEACQQVSWQELLPRTHLQPGYQPSRMHCFHLPQKMMGTHVRINYYPDGGVARLKLWGSLCKDRMSHKPIPQPAYCPIHTGRTCTVVPHGDCQGRNEDLLPSRQTEGLVEVSGQLHGGMGITCSNKHYGEPWHLIQTTLGRDMGDGWETARHPERPAILIKDPTTNLVASSLNDWAVLRLGYPTNQIDRIILDTKHFRGNYPESVLVEGCNAQDNDLLMGRNDNESGGAAASVKWFTLVPRGRMAPDAEHVYEASKDQISNANRLVSHVRVSIFPDGGLSRVRIYSGDPQTQ